MNHHSQLCAHLLCVGRVELPPPRCKVVRISRVSARRQGAGQYLTYLLCRRSHSTVPNIQLTFLAKVMRELLAVVGHGKQRRLKRGVNGNDYHAHGKKGTLRTKRSVFIESIHLHAQQPSCESDACLWKGQRMRYDMKTRQFHT